MFKLFGDIPHRQRAKEHGITFNKEKCKFEKEEIESFGRVFTKDGLKPSPDKVKAIKECGAPKSKEELKGFLGIAGYQHNFIQGYASIAAPLHQLTRKETKFHWWEKEYKASRRIQDSLSDDQTLAYFDPDKQIILRTEAPRKVYQQRYYKRDTENIRRRLG